MRSFPSPRRVSLLSAALLWLAPLAASAAEAPPVAYAQRVEKLEALPGFMPLFWDAKTGRLWLEIHAFDTDFLYVSSLPGGLGSNDVGLDRGQLGQERVVRFYRSGPRVLLVQPNLAYRANTADPAERQAVADSFASSVLAGFDIAAEENGRVLVDATDFFLRDAHDVVGTLKETKQGAFSLDLKRSAFFLPRTKGFPANTEVEVILTFAGNEPGDFVRSVTPEPRAITIRQHHSLIQLPDAGYQPRAFDPRAGYFPYSYADYATPIGESLVRRFITRHRLIKKDPSAERSEPVRPIVYYLDPGTPEPVRSALLDGARWWNQAFEAAGFINAFRVELLPIDADPMDVRYNVINWVHRSTRGWSYGASVIDPRTGEIIKGHVSLGSLRVRQDILIAEGLLAPYEKGVPADLETERMALARLRQLAAHEVGHTLGLAHNYIASTADRASVMDYPHPLVELVQGRPSLANAYATGIGAWDKVAIAYGYQQVPPKADEAAALDALLAEGRRNGLHYLTDQDARPAGSVHPQAHLWDSGADAAAELLRLLEVRSAALSRFGEAVIRPGRPLATLEEPLVTTYLLHRYQIEATAKVLGGQHYTYALRGDGQIPVTPVPPDAQRNALDALLRSVTPTTLALPAPILASLPPRPSGFGATPELFPRRTGLAFDALTPAETAADLVFSFIFQPERAARLVQQHARDAQQPGLADVIARVLDATWRQPAGPDYPGEVQRTVNYSALTKLIALAANPAAGPQPQAVVTAHLVALKDELTQLSIGATHPAQRAHLDHGARLIGRFLDNPKESPTPPTLKAPPGQPIGSTEPCDWVAR